ncbi:hypothetical protein Tco_0602956, partial [Tanacetum coccineum]
FRSIQLIDPTEAIKETDVEISNIVKLSPLASLSLFRRDQANKRTNLTEEDDGSCTPSLTTAAGEIFQSCMNEYLKGAATPIHDGMRTPMRDRAWNPYTPMRSPSKPICILRDEWPMDAGSKSYQKYVHYPSSNWLKSDPGTVACSGFDA